MKKVAATRGHSVRRMDFFVFLNGGAAARVGCERLEGGVAVANCYGFLLRRLTLTTASPEFRKTTFCWRLPGCTAIPGHFGEVSSHVGDYGKFAEMQEYF